MFRRLRQRRLFKELALIPLDTLRVADSITLGQLVNLDAAAMTKLEQHIAVEVNCEPWEVIVHKKSIKHPAYQARAGLDPEAIHVLSREGIPKMMSEYEDLISPHMPTIERLHVIAPVRSEAGTSRQERQLASAHMQQQIRDLVFEFVGGA